MVRYEKPEIEVIELSSQDLLTGGDFGDLGSISGQEGVGGACLLDESCPFDWS